MLNINKTTYSAFTVFSFHSGILRHLWLSDIPFGDYSEDGVLGIANAVTVSWSTSDPLVAAPGWFEQDEQKHVRLRTKKCRQEPVVYKLKAYFVQRNLFYFLFYNEIFVSPAGNPSSSTSHYTIIWIDNLIQHSTYNIYYFCKITTHILKTVLVSVETPFKYWNFLVTVFMSSWHHCKHFPIFYDFHCRVYYL